jgi:hypothetical protein
MMRMELNPYKAPNAREQIPQAVKATRNRHILAIAIFACLSLPFLVAIAIWSVPIRYWSE